MLLPHRAQNLSTSFLSALFISSCIDVNLHHLSINKTLKSRQKAHFPLIEGNAEVSLHSCSKLARVNAVGCLHFHFQSFTTSFTQTAMCIFIQTNSFTFRKILLPSYQRSSYFLHNGVWLLYDLHFMNFL